MINYCDKILRIYHYFKWYNTIKVVQYQAPKCYQKKHLNCTNKYGGTIILWWYNNRDVFSFL